MPYRASTALCPYVTRTHIEPKVTADVELGERLPIVFGNNVYLSSPTVLSHRISVSGDSKRLVHSVISLISLGEIANAIGKIEELEPATYKHGIKTGRSAAAATANIYSFEGWRDGAITQSAYESHGSRSYSYQVSAREVTIPGTLPNGRAVSSAIAFYYDGASWRSVSLTPNNTVSLPEWSSWVTLNTTETTAFSGLSTALTRFQSPTEEFYPPDFKVTKGKQIWRLEQYGQGQTGTVDFSTHSLIDLADGTEYTDNESVPEFDSDSPWIAVQRGTSERFADVVFFLAKTGYSDKVTLRSLFDYPSLIAANEHTAAQGLLVNGVLEDDFRLNELVNSHAKFFDLIPSTTESQLGFIPHTVESVKLEAIFTPINHLGYRHRFLDISVRNSNDYHAVISDWSSADYQGSVNYNAHGSLDGALSQRYDAHRLQNDPVAVAKQLKRIHASLSQQNLEIELLTPVPTTLEPGEFILASDPTMITDRSYAGGILSFISTGRYELSIPVETFRVPVDARPISNRLVYTTNGFIDVAEDDFISLDTVTQNETGRVSTESIYAKVTGKTTTLEGGKNVTTVAVQPMKWNGSAWEVAHTTIAVPPNTLTTFYQLKMVSSRAVFLDGDGEIVEANVSFSLEPTATELKYVVTFDNYTGAVRLTSPLIVEPVNTVWRVGLVEPVSMSNSQRVRVEKGHVVYRIVAQNYPFGSLALTQAVDTDAADGQETVRVVVQGGENYPDYDFSAYTGIPDLSDASLALVDWPIIDFELPQESIDSIIPVDLGPTETIPYVTSDQLSGDEIKAAYSGAVVLIQNTDAGDEEYIDGTGFVFSADGYVLTNAHVAVDTSIVAKLENDPSPYPLEIIYKDEDADIAVLKAVGLPTVPALVFGDGVDLDDGDPIFTIGHPENTYWQLSESTITPFFNDTLCTPGEEVKCYHSLDGLIAPGNSGGPVFDQYGRVIGMAVSELTAKGQDPIDAFIAIDDVRNNAIANGITTIPSSSTVANSVDSTTLGDYDRGDAISVHTDLAFGEGVTVIGNDGLRGDYTYFINKWGITQYSSVTVAISGLYSTGDLGSNFTSDTDMLNAAIAQADRHVFPDSTENVKYIGGGLDQNGTVPVANVNFILLPANQYDRLTAGYDTDNGFTWALVDLEGDMLRCYCLIKATGITQGEKQRLFYRELYRALGLFGESSRFSDSIFNPNTSATQPNETDNAALRLHYQPALTSGMQQYEAVEIINRIAVV